MMKSWSRLCFLVLAVSSLSRVENTTAVAPLEQNDDTDPAETWMQQPEDETGTGSNHLDSFTRDPQNQTTSNQTDPSTTTFKPEVGPNVTTAGGNNVSADARTTAPSGVPGSGGEANDVDVTAPVSTETSSSSPAPVPFEDKEQPSAHSSWGYVILVLIIVVIIALCVILYVLRRVSRTYSFDLQRPVPVNHLSEPTGTFEPVYLDDLDRPAPKDQTTPDDLSPPPVSNGTSLPSEEKGSSEENAPQEQPDANGLETSNTSPSLGDEPADKTSSPLSSANLLFDTIGEQQQNENNNNPSVCSTDPFVEINLDDPAWCDQLLTSPEAPSSVLPFSPFSFSSSSSSSSS